MTKYEEWPQEVRDAVEQYNTGWKYARQCMETLLLAIPEKEAAARVLMEGYGEWLHEKKTAESRLMVRGLTAEEIYDMALIMAEKESGGR